MKNLVKTTLAIFIIISLVLAVASCGGGNDPKSLAKQNVDLLQEWMNLGQQGIKQDDPKAVALQKKIDAAEKKVEKLSEADKKIYDEELAKLTGLKF